MTTTTDNHRAPLEIDGKSCDGEGNYLHRSGKLKRCVLAKPTTIDEQEYEEGGKKSVTTQAEINVMKGEEQKRLLVPEGEGRWAFGCKVNVSKARVEYIEKRQDWLPRAVVKIACKGL